MLSRAGMSFKKRAAGLKIISHATRPSTVIVGLQLYAVRIQLCGSNRSDYDSLYMLSILSFHLVSIWVKSIGAS